MAELDGAGRAALEDVGYVADAATVARLRAALGAGRPVLLSGPRGAGKTALATAMARYAGAALHRLECHEGLTRTEALYRWDGVHQLEAIREASARGEDAAAIERRITRDEYLVPGPLLAAISGDGPSVLLIDDAGRVGEEIGNLLATFLRDYEVIVPELGTYRARRRPWVILTCHEPGAVPAAVREQCVELALGYPPFEDEVRIVMAAAPGLPAGLAAQICNVVNRLRDAGLREPPGVGDTIDWAQALTLLRRPALDAGTLAASLDVVLKSAEDRDRVAAAGIDALAGRRLDLAG
jgi:MoxR-like ATPase